MRYKIQKGEYIGSAPYGYLKSKDEKNRLVVDESSVFVVREIFRLYMEGYGYAGIAGRMNARGYPSPVCRGKPGKTRLWSAVAVRRILCSRVYIGDTVQGVSEKVSFKSKKTRRLPESSWVVTPHTHEAIIDRDEFEEVQMIREGRKSHSGSNKGRIHVLRGMIFCGKCGSSMYARMRKKRPPAYICGSYGKKGRAVCTSHYVGERIILDTIIYELVKLLRNPAMINKVRGRIEKEFKCGREAEQRISCLKRQIDIRRGQQEELYMDKLEGKISEQLFLRTNTSLENRISVLAAELGRMNERISEALSLDELALDIVDYLQENNIDHEMVRALVEKVVVYDTGDLGQEAEGAIVVDFRFDNMYD